MGARFSRLKNWSAGEALTASDLNAEFNQIYNSLDPTGIDDESANDAAAQATSDPYPGSSLSKATSLETELQQLRYLIAQITGETYWYIDPDTNIAAIAANGWVTAARLASDAVETAKIKDANVTEAKIATGAVTAAKLASDAVETAKIKDANVTAAKLASDAVETAKIKDANVTAAKLASGIMIPSGTKMVFYQDTAPTGWTIENTLDDKLLFVTKGSVAGGQTGGGAHSTGTWTQPSHTLTVDEIPSHTHDWAGAEDASDRPSCDDCSYASPWVNSTGSITSPSAGGGGAHNHGNTWRPAAYCVIIATKD